MRRVWLPLAILSSIAQSGEAQDTIQAGDPVVQGSLLPVTPQRMEWFRRRGGDLIRMGAVTIEAEHTRFRDRPALLHRLVLPAGQLVDSALADPETLAPIAHRSHSPRRTMVLDFDGLRATGSVTAEGGSREAVRDVATHRPFDSTVMDRVLAALPLSNGFQAVLPFYFRERGGLVWHDVSVTGPRLQPVADGMPVETWRVEVRPATGRDGVTVHYIERDGRRTLRSEYGSEAVVLPLREEPNPGPTALAREWIGMAIDAMGGDLLREVDVVRTERIGYANALEQSERPEGPYIKVFEQIAEVRDRRATRIRRSGSSRSGPWSPNWSSELTYVVDRDAAVVSRGDRSGPASSTLQQELLDAVRLAPEQVLFTALASEGLRAIGDTVADGVRNLRVEFTLDRRRIQLLIDPNTGVPHGMAVRGPSSRGFDSMWGDVTLATTWYLWTLHDNGIMYPGAYRTTLNGQPLSDATYTAVSFDVPMAADSFAIDSTARQAFANQPQRTPGSTAFGTSFRGERLEPIPVADGVTVYPGSWYVAAVEQEDGIVVIEAPISSHYSTQAIAAVTEGDHAPVKAVVTTSDAWPHFAGTREYVARGVPIYHLDKNRPILRRFFDARYGTEPDSLERALTPPQLHAVSDRTVIGTGRNRIELYPVRGEGGERMMLAYLPAHRLLYASDLVQRLPDGSFWAPQYLAEVARVVAREGLQVETVFAMHTSPIPWSEVLDALPGRRTSDLPPR